MSPHGAGTGSHGAAETETGTTAPTETLLGRELARSWARGTALLPPDNILRRHTSPPAHGERKRAQTLLWAGASPAGTAWPPPPPARQGSLSPAPTPPTQGRLIPGARGATLTPGQCPAGWAGTIFCLKRKRSTQRKTSKGPSPSHPHTNRFI